MECYDIEWVVPIELGCYYHSYDDSTYKIINKKKREKKRNKKLSVRVE